MDELTFLLILAGIGIVLLVAMFTYYRHHKKIHDEIQDFNRHPEMDDILLDETKPAHPCQNPLSDDELPSSFSTTQDDNFDIDTVFHQSQVSRTESQQTRSNDVVDNIEQPASDSISATEIPETGSQPREAKASQVVQPDNKINQAAEANNTSKPIATASVAPQPLVSESESESESDAARQTIQQQAHLKTNKPAQSIEVICEPVPKGVNDLILSFTIVSRKGKFTGQNLSKALEDSGLRFGEMNIYHYPGDKSPDSYALFSAANLVEPGTFNLDVLEQFNTPGISLFMRLPTRKPAFVAFDEFLQVSRLLSQKLGGELCDEARNQLTQQCISHKKEQIKKLQFELTKAKKIAELSQ